MLSCDLKVETVYNEKGIQPVPEEDGEKDAESLIPQIEAVGEVCFGPNWRGKMAEVLGVDVRTLNRWRADHVELTSRMAKRYDIRRKLIGLMSKHMKDSRELVRQLRRH